jgi:hypothetical protein
MLEIIVIVYMITRSVSLSVTAAGGAVRLSRVDWL